jgi:acetate CoA/acetoacetate CoA-transferase alpha subunit
MHKAVSVEQAVEMIPDGASLLVGGFMGVGSPHALLAEIARQGKKNLKVIGNDSGRVGIGIGKLVDAKCVSDMIASHIGLNPETQRQMIAGEMKVELCQQGSLIERIRSGGYGLGGVLTPTGAGTIAADGKQTVVIDGKEFLIEKPIRADFALVGAHRVDYLGNVEYMLTARNFNPIMAMAADKVIVEPDNIVPVGVIPPDNIVTQHVVVDYIVKGGHKHG